MEIENKIYFNIRNLVRLLLRVASNNRNNIEIIKVFFSLKYYCVLNIKKNVMYFIEGNFLLA